MPIRSVARRGSVFSRRLAASPAWDRGLIAGAIATLVLAQRIWLWVLYGASIERTVSENAGWLTWQFLPLDALSGHLWAGLYELQQTPPLPHLVLGALLKLFAWPIGVAQALFTLQAAITAVTAVLLFLLLLRTGCLLGVAIGVALWFGLSTDVYLLELNSLGQLFYESGAMLFCTATALCLCANRRPVPDAIPSAASLAEAGLLTALAVLTRASFSYFAFPVAIAIAIRYGLRRLIPFLIPVLLLQGAWCAKNTIVHGRLTAATSSWTGLNAANGLGVAEGYGTPDQFDTSRFTTYILNHHDDYPEWLIRILEANGYVDWGNEGTASDVPAEFRDRDTEAQRLMGGTNPFSNTDALRVIAQQYERAVLRYSVAYPHVIFFKLFLGYHLFWQPIADYSGMFMGPLYVEASARPIFSSPLLIRHRPVYERAPASGGDPARVHPPTLSLIPLDTLSIYTITFLLPLTSLLDLAARCRGRATWIDGDLWVLIAIGAYGILVSIGVDLGENMRFRLAYEPVLIAITLGIVSALYRRLMRRGLGSSGAGPVA